MKLGTTELLLLFGLALVLFGGGKLAGVGKALGRSIKDFKEEVKDEDKEKEKEVNIESVTEEKEEVK